MIDPNPGGPEHRREQGFRMAGWDVDDQIPQVTLCNRLQVVADGAYMDSVDERRLRLEYMPALFYELM